MTALAKESILIWVPAGFKQSVRAVAKRSGRTISAVTRDALFSDPDLLDEYLATTPIDEVQPPAPVMHARRAERKAKAAKVGGDPDSGTCGDCGRAMKKVDDTKLGKTIFTRWTCRCGFHHLQRKVIDIATESR